MVVLSTAPPDPNSAARAFASQKNQSFLLGDPFLRDCLLQSAALLVPQDTSLPVSIHNWDIYAQTHVSPEKERVFVRNRLQRIQDQDIETVVDSLDASGRVLERLSGYHLKILKHHDDYPTVADLLRPDDRDTRQLQEWSADFSNRLHLKTPDIYVSFIPGLHDLPIDQRREQERSFLLRTLENWAVANDADPSQINLQWKPSGKPVAGIGGKTLDISLSHDNQYFLVAIGSCDLGCDLAPVTHRTAISGPDCWGHSPRRWLTQNSPAMSLIAEVQRSGRPERCCRSWMSRKPYPLSSRHPPMTVSFLLARQIKGSSKF